MLKLKVVVDDRARLVTAALAASDWPVYEQDQAPHAVHAHSKQLRQFMQPYRTHPAVVGVNVGLAQGTAVSDFFTAALRCTWPGLEPTEPLPYSLRDGIWLQALADFGRETAVAGFWNEHAAQWQAAQAGLARIFGESDIISFISQLLSSPVSRKTAVMPTITYPMLNPVLANTAEALFFILPPAKAWGESPPWPHGEDPGWAVAQTCRHLAAHFLKSSLEPLDETGQKLLIHAAVTLCLANDFDEAEAMAYLVRIKKERNLPRLPLIVEKLREHLAAADGRSLAHLFT